MQFIPKGPDIPERLLQDHEDGKVVFFCGAGISFPAGLPGFGGVVERLYEELGHSPSLAQTAAINSYQFDTAINLLEKEIVGNRFAVRTALAKILTPKIEKQNKTATHESLLTLAKSRSGQLRLITTNFDRLFETVIDRKSLSINRFQAPYLPVPKLRWDGLVYLHGLLSVESTESSLNNLVVSSGDFGLAYLIERWAARFVSELFRNYSVCFVGYSINDPILRYMMDALAADQLLGAVSPEMFAFGSYSKGKMDEQANEWQSKNVTPILYREHRNHFYLHKTLQTWGETYRDGLHGKEQVVVTSAMVKPLASTQQDDFVGRMLWALSDPSGVPAKIFSEINPAPDLDWLVPLCERRYKECDLNRFGVVQGENNCKSEFSFFLRPTPHTHSPSMCVVNGGPEFCGLDNVMKFLGVWLVRHLNDPKLILWFAKHGGYLHPRLERLIERNIGEYLQLEQDGNDEELNAIRANSPNAIPCKLMRLLWQLVLGHRLIGQARRSDLHLWKKRFKQSGLSTSLQLELRELLSPKIKLKEPFKWGVDDKTSSKTIKDFVDWEVVLTTHNGHYFVKKFSKITEWNNALPSLLFDFSLLLRDALDLMCELGGVDERHDRSHFYRPSISDHAQNNTFKSWTALITLTRDAWIATAETDSSKAILVAKWWWDIPYPLFKRLSLFAAAQSDYIPSSQIVSWLLSSECWWLWSSETQREVLRLLTYLSSRLDAAEFCRIEQAIIDGPPEGVYSNDIDTESKKDYIDRDKWLRFAKLKANEAPLSENAISVFAELSERHPEWHVSQNERDEFSVWMETGRQELDPLPTKRNQLVDWVRSNDSSYDDRWKLLCRTNFSLTAATLIDFAKQNEWPQEYWREALYAWSENKLKLSWHRLPNLLMNAPEEFIHFIARSLSSWLKSQAEVFVGKEDVFFKLVDMVLKSTVNDTPSGESSPLDLAINHSVGTITEALFSWLYRGKVEDGQRLPSELKTIFTPLTNLENEIYRHARVIMAAHIITLFRVDEKWTKEHVLPHFNWDTSVAEAKAVWSGFLWSPRVYVPLLAEIKDSLILTAEFYEQLGDYASQYASLVAFIALDSDNVFTKKELASVLLSLPSAGLEGVANSLVHSLEGAGDRREAYWHNRILPIIKYSWPKEIGRTTAQISSYFAMICVFSSGEFSNAFNVLKVWLGPSDDLIYLLTDIGKYELCAKFPTEMLEFLDIVIGPEEQWLPSELHDCLKVISEIKPDIVDNTQYQRISNLMRQQ